MNADHVNARRDAIEETARRYLEAARKSGNTKITYADALRRVSRACRTGDEKRANRNR